MAYTARGALVSNSVDAIVVGAGVAGISAASCLADAGLRVTLLEQRKLLGGRAGSFQHDIGGPGGLVDNCRHVLVGCCTELQSLYRRLGVSDLIRFDDTIEFADSSGRRARLKAAPLPSPFHLGPSMARSAMMTAAQKLQVARGMMSMYLIGKAGRERREGVTFRAYLKSVGQSDAVIRDHWDVIIVSALNETCAEASAKYGMQVFQESFLATRGGYRLGYALSPLSRLYGSIPGVEVRPATGVSSLLVENDRVIGVTLTSGEAMRAKNVVIAASPSGALPLLRPLMHLDPQLPLIEKIEFRAILGAHLLYDRPVPLRHPVSMLGSRLQWVFPDENRPELLHGVVSAADLLEETSAELPAIFDREIKAAMPELAACKLVDNLIVKESRATFRPLPGVDHIRPSQRTLIPGLTLAGDYTRTDWPATMEGAARSGRLAAESIVSRTTL